MLLDMDNEGANGASTDDQAVFYNPAQVVNRDLTICIMEAFSRMRRDEPARKGGVGGRGITILEALSASGLRSVRYWKEITGLRCIIANDLDPDAVECMRRNLAFNAIPTGGPTLLANAPAPDWRGVVANCDDAVVLMQRLALDTNSTMRLQGVRVVPPAGCPFTNPPTLPAAAAPAPSPSPNVGNNAPVCEVIPLLQGEKMDIVDLDPYGTASPFLEPAVACIREGGLLCITSTDSAILCGSYPETAHAKYNSIAIRNDACHEMAVRILLAAVERVANKHRKYIVPLLSLHIDFYVRVFVRVYTQQAEVKLACCKLGHFFKCTRCPAFTMVPMARAKAHGKKQQEGGAEGGKKGAKKRGRDANKGPEDAVSAATAEQETEEGLASVAEPASASAVAALPPPVHFPPIHNRQVPFSVNASTIHGVGYECRICHGAVAIAGPLYAAPIHDHAFIESLLAVMAERQQEQRLTAYDRIKGLVIAARDELPNAPMFVELPEIASLCRCKLPPLPEFVAGLHRLGYACSQVHCNKHGLKTDAPHEVLVGLMLSYKAQFYTDDATPATGETGSSTAAAVPLPPPAGRQVYVPLVPGDFTYDKSLDFRRAATGVAKFVPNAPGWGPRKRHQGVLRAEEEQ